MTDDEQRQLDRVRQDLVNAYAGRVAEQQILERFDAIVASFDDAPVRAFVPVLAHRRMRQELSHSR